MSDRMFTHDQKQKLKQIVNEGTAILSEIEDLKAGLSDTVKAIAEEMEIKPAILNKAIKIAHKANLGEVNQDHSDLNSILETVGRTM